MQRRSFLKLAGMAGAAAMSGCVTVAAKPERTRDESGAERFRERCQETLAPVLTQLPQALAWLKTVKGVAVLKARVFPQSAEQVIYVRDQHTPEAMKAIAGLIADAQKNGWSELLGLEGIKGPVDEKRRERMLEQVNLLEAMKHEKLRQYGAVIPPLYGMAFRFFGSIIEKGDFPEYSAPGRGYLRLLKQLPARVVGLEKDNNYDLAVESSDYRHREDTLKALHCVAKNIRQARLKCRELLIGEDYAEAIRRREPLLRELIVHLEQLQAAAKTRFGQLLSPEEEKKMDEKRGTAAAECFTECLRQNGHKKGILIYGRGHRQELEAALERDKITYVSVQSESVIPTDDCDVSLKKEGGQRG